MRLFLAIAAALAANALPASAAAQTDNASKIDLELYGSLRLHATVATVDEAADGQDETDIGLTDAYSRVGAKATSEIGGTTLTAKFELNINSADLDVGDPSFFDDQNERLYSVSASGDWGTVLAGKDWLPYYNNVGYPVDYFSSIFAGYTTYAYFRELQLTYVTPQISGFQGSLTRMERTNSSQRGWHYTGSYTAGGLTLAVGREDMDGALADTQGAAISYKTGPWYLAAKYENNDAAGDIYNAFAQFTHGKFDYKFGVGVGDQYSGETYHAGVDYRLKDDFKLFAEIYSEERNYAILSNDAQRASDYLGAGGFGARQSGKALALGFRLDLSTK